MKYQVRNTTTETSICHRTCQSSLISMSICFTQLSTMHSPWLHSHSSEERRPEQPKQKVSLLVSPHRTTQISGSYCEHWTISLDQERRVHHPLVHYQAAAADRGAGQLTALLGILRTPTRARNLPGFATAWQNRAQRSQHR